MDNIQRNSDFVLGNLDLEDLYTFKDFPVFMGCTDESESEDLFFDMNWKISQTSGMIQLNPLLPLEVVYKNEHGSGTTGNIWNEHHEAFAKFINRYKIKNVLEIGGYHGILADKYMRSNDEVTWTIIDPNPTAKESKRLSVIRGFFDNKFSSNQKYDAIIHSHLIEHVYDVNEFMSHKSSFMKNGDLLMFSLPNLRVMLENKYTNCLNFEHTVYLTEDYVDYFLAKYGFQILDKDYFREDHSIFYCAKKNDEQPTVNLPKNLYEINKNTFKDFVDHHIKDAMSINKAIDSSNGPVFLFGAHIFSQYMIAFGLNTEKIECLLDNDSKKQGKRLYGTKLICKSPEILKTVSNATIILRAGFYNEEIKKAIIDNINSKVSFI